MPSKLDILRSRAIVEEIRQSASLDEKDLVNLEDVVFMHDVLYSCHNLLDEAGIDDTVFWTDEKGTRPLLDRIKALAMKCERLEKQVEGPTYQSPLF